MRYSKDDTIIVVILSTYSIYILTLVELVQLAKYLQWNKLLQLLPLTSRLICIINVFVSLKQDLMTWQATPSLETACAEWPDSVCSSPTRDQRTAPAICKHLETSDKTTYLVKFILDVFIHHLLTEVISSMKDVS